jgi:hypothetical protein
MKLNGMKKSMIFPGQSLIVAGSGPTTKSATRARATTKGKAAAPRKSTAASKSTKRSARKPSRG